MICLTGDIISTLLQKQSDLLLNADDLDAMWFCLRENCVIDDATGAEKVYILIIFVILGYAFIYIFAGKKIIRVIHLFSPPPLSSGCGFFLFKFISSILLNHWFISNKISINKIIVTIRMV